MDKQTPKPSQKVEVSFRPITDGLGFHPFSDGLPYAPISKSPRPQSQLNRSEGAPSPVGGDHAGANSVGTGATAAGPPQMVVPRKNPTANSDMSQSLFNSQMSSKRASPVPQVSVPVAKPKSDPLPAQAFVRRAVSYVPGSYYLPKRIIAYGVDCLFNFGLCGAILLTLAKSEGVGKEIFGNSTVLGIAAVLLVILHWLLLTFQEVVFYNSIGKRLLGLRLSNHAPLLFFRAVFFVPSFFLMGSGLVWSLFDSKKRCLHDRIVGIQPIEVKRT